MSRYRPVTAGRARPVNLAVSMRDAYLALDGLALRRLAEHGYGDVRQAHAAVFEHLDETGTTVNELAARAFITKQAMAELVRHLEDRGYVHRVPAPDDRRAKLVLPTARGRDVVLLAQAFVPELEARVDRLLGADRAVALRYDLEAVRRMAEDEPPSADRSVARQGAG